MGVGTSGLRFAVHSEASDLLVMGTSVVPSDSGQFDAVLPCTVGSEINPGADGRCTSVLQALGWLWSSVTSHPAFFHGRQHPKPAQLPHPFYMK